MFVGNISWDISWQDLKAIFTKYGEVTFVRLITDRETGKSKGFAFVEFADAQSASDAKEALNWEELNGRELRIDFAEERKDDNKKAPRHED